MTFLLVITVYAAAVAKPGHGNTAPLAIGLSLYAAALTGEHKGGGPLQLPNAVVLTGCTCSVLLKGRGRSDRHRGPVQYHC